MPPCSQKGGLKIKYSIHAYIHAGNCQEHKSKHDKYTSELYLIVF